jgi:hypothetical protein
MLRAAALVLAAGGAACSPVATPAAVPAAADPPRADAVRLMSQREFAELRAAGTIVVSAPLGDVSASEPCTAGAVDAACEAAARQRLREAAAARGADLVVLHPPAALQTFPPRYAISGIAYDSSTR